MFWRITDTKTTSKWIKSLFLQIGVGKLWSENPIWLTAWFCKSRFIDTQLHQLIYTLSVVVSWDHSRDDWLWCRSEDIHGQKYLLWPVGTSLPMSAPDFWFFILGTKPDFHNPLSLRSLFTTFSQLHLTRFHVSTGSY